MKFSIVIPYKNSKDTIEWCIQSVLSQNFDKGEFEVICVDNGSNDGSRAIVERYKDNVKIVDSSAQTVSGVRNDGAKVAKGKVLAFLDSDCVAPAWWIREANRLFGRGEEVFGGAYVPAGDNEISRLWNGTYKREGEAVVNWIPSGAIFIARDVFENLGGFDDGLVSSEDVDICIRIAGAGHRIFYSPELDVTHLGEPDNLWDFFKKELWRGRGVPKLFRKHRGRVGLKPILFGIYSVFYLVLVLIGLFVDWQLGLGWFVMGYLPYLLLGIRNSRLRMMDKIRLSWMYFVYGVARGLSLSGMG